METGIFTGNESQEVVLGRKVKQLKDDKYRIVAIGEQFSNENYIEVKKEDLKLFFFLQHQSKIPFKIYSEEGNDENFYLLTSDGELIKINKFSNNTEMLNSLSSHELSFWEFKLYGEENPYYYGIYDREEKVGLLRTNEKLCL